jgi:ATP-dependent RNA helicase DeaD
MPSKDIGRIQIYDDFSTVDLPVGMRFKDLRRLSKASIVGQRMAMSKVGDPSPQGGVDDNNQERDENSTRRPPPFHEKAHKRPAGKSVGFSSPRKSYGKSNDRNSNKRRLRSRRDRS